MQNNIPNILMSKDVIYCMQNNIPNILISKDVIKMQTRLLIVMTEIKLQEYEKDITGYEGIS